MKLRWVLGLLLVGALRFKVTPRRLRDTPWEIRLGTPIMLCGTLLAAYQHDLPVSILGVVLIAGAAFLAGHQLDVVLTEEDDHGVQG